MAHPPRRTQRWVLARALPLLLAGCSSGPVSVGDDRLGATASDGSPPMDADLVAKVLALADPGHCDPATDVVFPPRPGEPADVAMCRLSNAVYWKSGMDIMCDGQETVECHGAPDRTGRTVGRDSHGDSLNPVALRYVQVPEPDRRFDYSNIGLDMGSAVIVVYRDRYQF